jgi:hypothetical protein
MAIRLNREKAIAPDLCIPDKRSTVEIPPGHCGRQFDIFDDDDDLAAFVAIRTCPILWVAAL